MSAVAERHIMQVMDWSKYSLEEWLYQFGAWQYSSSGTCGKSINPIAVAMDQSAKKLKQKKLASVTEQEIIANYFSDNNEDSLTLNRPKQPCCISDNEARAVQKLILDMQGMSDVMDGWLRVIMSRYFYNKSWAEFVVRRIVRDEDGNRKEVVIYTQMDARFDVKCGLAALHVRYPFIPFGS